MKETIESVDKLQDLDEANATKAALEIISRAIEDQVIKLQWQVQALQAEAMEKWATDDKVIELKNELKDMVARGGDMFIEGQDSMKEELIKHFLIEDFSWIDDILPKEDDKKEQEGEEGRKDENNPFSPTSTENNASPADDNVIKGRREGTKDSPAL